MDQLLYRPRRLLRRPAWRGLGRRMLSFLLCASVVLALFPAAARAAEVYTASFVNYDLSSLETAIPLRACRRARPCTRRSSYKLDTV